jgi:hypothetical protein
MPTPTPEGVSGETGGQAQDVNKTTYVTAGMTLSGQAAISAMAADGYDSVGVKAGGSTKLSSFAIVGIVGGILVFFIAVYIAWYQWVSSPFAIVLLLLPCRGSARDR